MYSTILGVAICLSFPPGFKGNTWPRSVNFLTIFDTVFDVTPVQVGTAEKLSRQVKDLTHAHGPRVTRQFWFS